VLVINCATSNPANVALWKPGNTPDAPQQQQQQQDKGDGSTTAAAAADAAAGGGQGGGSSSSSSSGCSWLPWVVQIRSNPASGQVDVLTAATREGIEEQASAGRGVWDWQLPVGQVLATTHQFSQHTVWLKAQNLMMVSSIMTWCDSPWTVVMTASSSNL
jgi:hypothetical protein